MSPETDLNIQNMLSNLATGSGGQPNSLEVDACATSIERLMGGELTQWIGQDQRRSARILKIDNGMWLVELSGVERPYVPGRHQEFSEAVRVAIAAYGAIINMGGKEGPGA